MVPLGEGLYVGDFGWLSSRVRCPFVYQKSSKERLYHHHKYCRIAMTVIEVLLFQFLKFHYVHCFDFSLVETADNRC